MDLTPGEFGVINTRKQKKTSDRRKAGYRAYATFCGYDNRTRQVERVGRTAAEARTRLGVALEEMIAESRSSSSRRFNPSTKFQTVARDYMASCKVSDNSADRYRSRLNCHLIPRLGAFSLRDLNDVVLLEDMFEDMADGRGINGETVEPVAPNGLRQIRSVLSNVFNHAKRYGGMTTNPVREMQEIRGGAAAAPRSLSAEERQVVFDTMGTLISTGRMSDTNGDLLFLLGGTGLRIGEGLALRPRDVNLTKDSIRAYDPVVGEVTIPPGCLWVNGNIVYATGKGLRRNHGKTFRARRVIEMPPTVVAMLTERCTLPWVEDDLPLFPSEVLTWQYPPNVRRQIRRLRDASKLGFLCSHVFRKTVATILEEAGFTGRQLADFLGHSQVTTTLNTYLGRGAVVVGTGRHVDEALVPRAG